MTRRSALRAAVALLLLPVAVAGGPGLAVGKSETPLSPPRGIFALSSGARPIPARVLEDATVNGISLRATWSDMEPRAGAFSWVFDREIERAARAGKPVMLRVTAGANTPDWVFKAGAERFDFTEANPHRKQAGAALRTPVPWDPVFRAKWTAFIKALGERYADRDAVLLVHMAGPSKASAEMHLPRTGADKSHWTRIGYSKAKLVGAWQSVIDAYAAAFPRQYLAMNVATPVYDDGVVEEVLAYASRTLGRRFAVQHNALAAKTRPQWITHARVAGYRDRALVGFQLLSPVSPQGAFNEEGRRFGGTMAQATKLALDAGARYIEIYASDLGNEAAAAAFRDFTRRAGN
jgi:hypothetical protein